jgi:hypothetical protein
MHDLREGRRITTAAVFFFFCILPLLPFILGLEAACQHSVWVSRQGLEHGIKPDWTDLKTPHHATHFYIQTLSPS